MKPLRISFAFLFSSFVCQAQSPVVAQAKLLPKHNMSLNVTQLAVGEFRVGYERLLGKRHSMGLELAYKPDFDNQNLSFVVLGNNTKAPYMASNSYTGFLNYRFYLTKKEYPRIRFFLEGKFMVRYLEYHDKVYSQYNPKESIPSDLESGYDHMYGGVLLFGTRLYVNPSRTIFLEAYAGFSIREAHLHTQIKSTCTLYSQGSKCDREHLQLASDDSTPFDNTTELRAAPQVGLKIGAAF